MKLKSRIILDAMMLTFITTLSVVWLWRFYDDKPLIDAWWFGFVGGYTTASIMYSLIYRQWIDINKQQIELMQSIIDRKQAYIDKHFGQAFLEEEQS